MERSPRIVHHDGHSDIDNLGEGGSYYIAGFVEDPQADFGRLREEVKFREVWYRGRRMEREKEAFCDPAADGTVAHYRYPGLFYGSSPFHPLVAGYRDRLQELSPQFPLNHCIATLYRDGNASIGEHNDKEGDIGAGSFIYDISLGAPRVLYLISNDGRRKVEIVLQAGSLFVLDWATNQRWKHAVPAAPEGAEARISLVFRSITTKYDPKSRTVTEIDGSVTKRPRNDRADSDLGKPRGLAKK